MTVVVQENEASSNNWCGIVGVAFWKNYEREILKRGMPPN
jgi:hypothetical protein